MGRLLTLLRPKGRAFSPLDLPGLALWLDASDLSTITHDAGAVSQWDDKSPNGWHVAQGTGAAQPLTGAATRNGRNVLVFDGTNDFLINAVNTGLSLKAITLFTVATETTEKNFSGIFAMSSAGANDWQSADGFMLTHGGASHRIELAGGVSAAVLLQQAGTGATPWSLVRSTLGSTSQTLFVNGVSTATDDYAGMTTHTAGMRVGANKQTGATGFFLNGQIAEIRMFSRVLTADEIAANEADLAAKWGIAL